MSVRSIVIPYLEKDRAYFGEALDMCAQLNIVKLMEFNKDFDAGMVAQFMPLFTLALMRSGP